uniref:Endoribonuclease L-PSP/chorismate mutase-like domain-containing protein n=1 Tax=Chlorobium chlorochromatii (strain CaD3) TaxID=340177 RepID=Q3ASE5_CHLCH
MFAPLLTTQSFTTMSIIEERILAAGYQLPQPPAAAGLYVPAMKVGNIVYTSGQLPLKDGALVELGGRGAVSDATLNEAAEASRVAVLNGLAAIKSVAGSLEAIQQIVKLTVYVASSDGFSMQHMVANGASSLLNTIFQENGVHVRSAIGVKLLPLNASIEVELLVLLSEQ